MSPGIVQLVFLLLNILRDLCLLAKEQINTSPRNGSLFSEMINTPIINYKGEPRDSWCIK